MADVFISYSREDEGAARRVAKALQAAGFDVWWDANLPAHRAYSEVIERNLEAAKAVVALWSQTAAKSQWVRAEADFARNAGKLVQATLDGALPPMPFNQIQCAELKGWRGSQTHPGWTKLKGSVETLVSGEERPVEAPPQHIWERLQPYRWWLAAGLALLVVVAAVVLTLRSSVEERKPVLAVLPFKSLDSRDESLAAGMWEDTRQQIGRNPQLVVLGPNTAEELAKKGPSVAKRAAAYLLEANIRSAGDRIRVSANLVRTEDGAQLWSQNFDRKLDDVFALQSDIAREIEGRIRGRLAQQGGVRPEHIATSGDVYALYSDARSKLRKRNPDLMPLAQEQLEQVVRLDPNFAPGWATLAEAERLVLPSEANNFALTNKAEGYARRAIELAPNLAAAHGALALALNLRGPVARAEVERAVQLDPNDYESVVWLGIMLNEAGQTKEALEVYTRAANIEPLYWPAVLNRLNVLLDLGDYSGAERLRDDEKRLGARHLATAAEMEIAKVRGDFAHAINVGLGYWQSGTPDGRAVVGLSLWTALLQLGYLEEALKVSPAPDFALPLWKDDPRGLNEMERHSIAPRQFFAMNPLPANAGRVYVTSGRGAKLAQMYLSLHVQPDEFAPIMDDRDEFLIVAPLVAVALRDNGHAADAQRLLSVAEASAKQGLGGARPKAPALLARIYAAEGRNEDALSLLTIAVNRGWLPSLPELQSDIGRDPVLAGLRSDPRFDHIRKLILGTIQRQRAQVGHVTLN
jgi:TolB-like protein